MNRHYIDKRFYEELDGLEANPPVEAWVFISEAVDKKSGKPLFANKFRFAAVLTAFVVAVFSLWMLMPDDSSTQITGLQQVFPDIEALEPASIGDPVSARFTDPEFRPLASNEPSSIQHTDYTEAALPLKDTDDFGSQPMPSLTLNSPIAYNSPSRNNLQANVRQTPAFLDGQPQPERMSDMAYTTLADDKNVFNIRLGTYFAPQYNYRFLTRGSTFGIQNIPFNDLEEQVVTYGVGLSTIFNVSARLRIETGLHFLNTGQYVKEIQSYTHSARLPLFNHGVKSGQVATPQSIMTSQGTIEIRDNYHYFDDNISSRIITSEKIDDVEGKDLKKGDKGVTQMFRFIQLPVIFRYDVYQRGVDVHLKGGFSGNYLFSNQVYLGSAGNEQIIGKTRGVRKINFSAIAGLSFELPVSGNLSVHLEPTAQVFLNPVLQEGMMTQHAFPYSFSLQTGVSYGF
ncbi:MAG: hypothetical protein R6U62_05875 [Bacteroidales bacterium]